MIRPTRVLLATVALAALVTACGADQPESAADGVASLERTGDSGPGGATASDDTTAADVEAPDDIEEAMALFQACMEEHGVEGGGFAVATPADGDQVQVGTARIDETIDAVPFDEFDAEEFMAADEACRPHLANAMPEFDLTPEQEAALEDAQLEFSKCMDEHGVELPDVVVAGGAGPAVRVETRSSQDDGGPAVRPDDIDMDAFNAAAEQCQSVYDDYPELDDVMGGRAGAPTMRVLEAGEAP